MSSPHYQAVGALALGQRKLGVEVGAVAHQRAVTSPSGRVLRAVLRVCLSTKASDSLLDRTLKKVNRLEQLLTKDIPGERDDRQFVPVDAGRFAQGDGDPLLLC